MDKFDKDSDIDADTEDTTVSSTKTVKRNGYEIVKAPHETVGKHLELEGEGQTEFTTIDDAIESVEKAGFEPGRSCRYIQHCDGKMYAYAAGNENGEAGPETWRLDPTEYDEKVHETPAAQEPTKDNAAELFRTTSMSTQLGLGSLQDWLRPRVDGWSTEKLKAGDISEGHAIVYTICTESGQPLDAQQQCYELFIEYVRAVTDKYGDSEEHDAIVSALKKVFKYLDQHYTNTQPRSTTRGRKPTSQLAAGQVPLGQHKHLVGLRMRDNALPVLY